ncbi:MAG: metal ABC transporter ATP-binding protein [Bacteroidales bacterium]|nr:metal ABC transporter ATP-binding protein [Bacteroidales bacterium]
MEINEGDYIGMIGPNGGGKSTIIKIIMGLLKPWSGKFEIGTKQDGEAVKIGYLPQYQLFDKSFPITVQEVIMSGLMGTHNNLFRFNKQQKEETETLINTLGLESVEKQSIGELSGGQMQRVFLGRALISNPDLLILDEPVTYVDNKFENEMYELLQQINKRTAILLVSHDVGQIVSFVKTIACVNHYLHYHPSNKISEDILASYDCPIELITHGKVPHRVLHNHPHHD